MQDKWKKILIITIIVIVLGSVGFIAYKVFINENSIKYNDNIANADNIVSQQDEIDKGIIEAMDNEEYTFNSPLILKNPYIISPLSALIIFQTKNEVKYDVYINDIKFTSTEKSKKHSIPIYGLIAGKDNVVKLVGSDNSTKEYPISSDEYNIKLSIEKNSTSNNGWYFLTSPNDIGHIAINSKGDVVWYLTYLGAQDIEFLSNGHMLISNNEYAGTSSFTGFYEIDYLGKIYKSYTLENSYHHEVNELSDGNLMVAGEKEGSKYNEAYIYTIDKETGKEIKSLDLYDVLSKVDSVFANSLEGKDFINNSIYYNEKNDQLVLSLRGLNTVMCVDYTNKSIKWMLANKDDWSNAFEKYILKAKDGSRLPVGQHTAFINSNGQLGLLNNDYDVNNTEKVFVKDYLNNYSSATLYDINENDMSYKTAWNYVDDNKDFNYALSSFNIAKDNHKIINFGWIFPSSAYQNETSVVFDELHETFSRIIDLDENNNVSFKAALKSNIYRVFKHDNKVENMNNYIPEQTKVINTMPYSVLEQVSTMSIQNSINNAEEAVDDISFENNTINIATVYDSLEDVKLVFKSDLISYIYSYKPKNKKINNKLNLSIRGKYDVYIVVDDVYYKTGKILDASGKTLVIKSA